MGAAEEDWRCLGRSLTRRGLRAPLLAVDEGYAPNGIRTRATTLKGWRPRPLVDGGGLAEDSGGRTDTSDAPTRGVERIALERTTAAAPVDETCSTPLTALSLPLAAKAADDPGGLIHHRHRQGRSLREVVDR